MINYRERNLLHEPIVKDKRKKLQPQTFSYNLENDVLFHKKGNVTLKYIQKYLWQCISNLSIIMH